MIRTKLITIGVVAALLAICSATQANQWEHQSSPWQEVPDPGWALNYPTGMAWVLGPDGSTIRSPVETPQPTELTWSIVPGGVAHWLDPTRLTRPMTDLDAFGLSTFADYRDALEGVVNEWASACGIINAGYVHEDGTVLVGDVPDTDADGNHTITDRGFTAGVGHIRFMAYDQNGLDGASSSGQATYIPEPGAAGYGELAGTHFSFGPRHPFINVPTDHPLFLALADIAAINGLPIDIHMEAVPKNMPRPKGVGKPLVSPNPKELTENIKGLENLLAHNRKAKIVWAHVGWGHTGERSAALTRTLLKKHSNLYLGLKFHNHSRRETQLLLPNGKIRTDWLTLIGDYPDRFVLGSDQIFYDLNKMLSEKGAPWGAHHSRTIIDQLPQKLAQKIGVTNPEKVYKLK